MEDVRIILSASWMALMLTYLLGDVLRIYAGDFKPGKIAGRPATQNLLLGIGGNGKGGGIAALGLVPEQLGVSERILREDYILQVAYLDRSSRKQVEDEHIRPFFLVDHESSVEAVDDYRSISGLQVEPPEVYRYFVRVKPEVLDDFAQKNNLGSLKRNEFEDEFVYQNSYRLNLQYYSSLGEKKAFVVSHG